MCLFPEDGPKCRDSPIRRVDPRGTGCTDETGSRRGVRQETISPFEFANDRNVVRCRSRSRITVTKRYHTQYAVLSSGRVLGAMHVNKAQSG